jgi:hypothetical protein
MSPFDASVTHTSALNHRCLTPSDFIDRVELDEPVTASVKAELATEKRSFDAAHPDRI